MARAGPTKASAMMATAGTPAHSNSMASRTLRDEHDPQSPMAVMTASAHRRISALSDSLGATLTLALR